MKTVDIYFPIIFSSCAVIPETEQPITQLLGQKVSVLSRNKDCSVLIIHDVLEYDAESVVTQFRALLPLLAVYLTQGIQSPDTQIKKVSSSTFDGQYITLFPSGQAPKAATCRVSSHCLLPAKKLFAAFEECAALPYALQPNINPKLSLALDIFAAVPFETSISASFILLTTVLEVLMDDCNRPQFCIDLIDQFVSTINLIIQSEPEQKDKEPLNDLVNSISSSMKKRSKTKSVQKLVCDCATQAGVEEPVKKETRAKFLYNIRSKLVHEGKPVSNENLSELCELVRLVLWNSAKKALG